MSGFGMAARRLGVSMVLVLSHAGGAGTIAPSVAQTATASPSPPCLGDCNANAVVAVNELIVGVSIALGNAALSACPAFDQNDDGMVGVNELVAGVNNLLYGCGVAPPTPPPSATATATPSPSPPDTPTATPTATRTAASTPTRTRTPTAAPPLSVCGGPVSPLPVLCNLTVIPNPVSRSGTIAFRFGVSDLDGNLNLLCIQLTHPPLEPQVTCAALVPPNRLVNSIQTTTPVSASPLLFGTYNAAVQAFDAAGNQSNLITATFQVQ